MSLKKEELHGYHCDDCDEWTFIKNLKYPASVHCAYCGVQGFAITSEGLKKLTAE